MRLFRRGMVSLTAVAAMALAPAASGTNGMFMIGWGSKMTAMGGAAMANPQDALAGAVNPAAITRTGNRFDAGIDLFFPEAAATTGVGTASETHDESKAGFFPLPHIGVSYQWSDRIALGFTAVGVGGGGSRYETNLFNAIAGGSVDRQLGVVLAVMQMNPTVAFEVTDNHSVGASMILGFQQFRATGLGFFSNFTSSGLVTEKLTNNGEDHVFGLGGRVGYLGEFFNDRLRVGAAYSSEVRMKNFDKYADLFAEGGDLDTPANYGVGVALDPTPKTTVAVDWVRYLYDTVRAISNDTACPPVPGCAAVPGSAFPVSRRVNALGNKKGLGFGWENQTVIKAGVSYDYSPRWTFRGGWNYGDSPIPEEDGATLFSVVAPATTRHHLTLGATYAPDRTTEWNFAYMHAFTYEQQGPTFIGQTEIGMQQNLFGLTYSKVF